MADVQSATCDFCGELKKEANHWYRVWKAYLFQEVVVSPWSRVLEKDQEQFHACGEDHALKLAARLLGKLAALPDPRTDAPSDGPKA